MDEQERLTYIMLAFEMDFANIGKVESFTRAEWKEYPQLDILGMHSRYGVSIPVLEEDWIVKICPEIISDAVQYLNDGDLLNWVLYLIAHLQLHLICMDCSLSLDDPLTPEEEEFKVQEMFEDADPVLFSAGQTIKALMGQ